MPNKVSIFWFRRDLRLNDNAGLFNALAHAKDPVLPIFIFDSLILDKLEDRSDRRVNFIYQTILQLKKEIEHEGRLMHVYYGKPAEVFKILLEEFDISAVYTNRDYEPYALERDLLIHNLLQKKGIALHTFKDQVIFEKDEIIKADGKPYHVFTPYANKWKETLKKENLESFASEKNFRKLAEGNQSAMPTLKSMGFVENKISVSPRIDRDIIRSYHNTRNLPGVNGTSRLGLHLRFGTISIRELASFASNENQTFLNELIWREFFMTLLWHYPRLVNHCFKPEYEGIQWRNNEAEFHSWCQGKTGYPLVDAGMRELNETGFMHNRVRMVAASFLVKHLLVDWKWGEAYFAEKLLDYELSSNNGNWQWVAGCGCDAAPYFRIFNPQTQAKKFDPDGTYIKKWLPDLDTLNYPLPIVQHELARERCLKTYKNALTAKQG